VALAEPEPLTLAEPEALPDGVTLFAAEPWAADEPALAAVFLTGVLGAGATLAAVGVGLALSTAPLD